MKLRVDRSTVESASAWQGSVVLAKWRWDVDPDPDPADSHVDVDVELRFCILYFGGLCMFKYNTKLYLELGDVLNVLHFPCLVKFKLCLNLTKIRPLPAGSSLDNFVFMSFVSFRLLFVFVFFLVSFRFLVWFLGSVAAGDPNAKGKFAFD
jgi:hypothetical protein